MRRVHKVVVRSQDRESGTRSNFWVRINPPNARPLGPNATVRVETSSPFSVTGNTYFDMSIYSDSFVQPGSYSTQNAYQNSSLGRAEAISGTVLWQIVTPGMPCPITSADALQNRLLHFQLFDERTNQEVAITHDWAFTLVFECDDC